MNPSPRAHVYRLIAVLALAAVAFIAVRTLVVPDSWDTEAWYRRDAVEELKQQPMRFGGNESCTGSACHEDDRPRNHQYRYDSVARGRHQGLACESCHGPLSEHVVSDKTIAHAKINANNDLCLACHQRLVSRPEEFAQFSTTLLYHGLLNVTNVSPCRACHDPHEPK